MEAGASSRISPINWEYGTLTAPLDIKAILEEYDRREPSAWSPVHP
jgi:hypothetical protein